MREKNKHCIDCKILIWSSSIRCRHCARIYQYATRPETKPRLGKIGVFLGKHHTKISKKKISKTRIELGLSKGTNNSMFGKHHNKKTRKQISLSLGGTGTPYETYSYPKKFLVLRPKILKKDNYTCQKCGQYGTKGHNKLSIHHIDYNKMNSKEDNLITLCQLCNLKVNFNRDYWYSYFLYKMENR